MKWTNNIINLNGGVDDRPKVKNNDVYVRVLTLTTDRLYYNTHRTKYLKNMVIMSAPNKKWQSSSGVKDHNVAPKIKTDAYKTVFKLSGSLFHGVKSPLPAYCETN